MTEVGGPSGGLRSTHVGFGRAVDHVEGAVGQVEASEAAGSLRGGGWGWGGRGGRQKHIHKSAAMTRREASSTPSEGTTHDDSCLATTRQPLTHGDGMRWDEMGWDGMGGGGRWRREEGGVHHGPDVRLEPDIESWGRRRTQTRKRHEGRHGWGGRAGGGGRRVVLLGRF